VRRLRRPTSRPSAPDGVGGTIRRLAGLLGAVAVTAALLPASASASVAARGTPGFCPNGNGVTVVVDFQELGGTTMVRCAPGEQATGLAALENAGFQVTGTQRWGEGFVCRLQGKPTAAAEACINTPPATAYWSYWYASNGGSWKYSEWGVLNRKPPLGSFEGWSFAKNKTAATNPPPGVQPVRPTSGGGSSGGSGGAGGGSASTGGSGGGGSTAGRPGNPGNANDAVPEPGGANETKKPPGTHPARPSAPSSSAAAVSSTVPPTSGTAGGEAWTGGREVEQTAAGREDDLPTGFLVGGVLVVALAAGASLTWYRRRRAGGG
jgi:hypothetical protein